VSPVDEDDIEIPPVAAQNISQRALAPVNAVAAAHPNNAEGNLFFGLLPKVVLLDLAFFPS